MVRYELTVEGSEIRMLLTSGQIGLLAGCDGGA